MKYTLLAYAALFPGFLSLFVSLVVPSTIYNKKGATSDPKKWKNEFEWGNSFELLEIPISTNTSEGIKRLTFSQVIKLIYLLLFHITAFLLSYYYYLIRLVDFYMNDQMEQQYVLQYLDLRGNQV